MLDAQQWACNHDFGEWVITKEATETETGMKERECSKCGYVETQTIPATSSEPTEIALTFDPQLTTWTNDDVVVTASLGASGDIAQINQSLIKRVSYTEANDNIVLANNTGYTIQMSKDGTNWSTTNSLTYTENGKVYARVMKDGNQVGETAESEVTNIDKTKPIAGTLKVFDRSSEGPEIEIFFDSNNCITEGASGSLASNLFVELVDGEDDESGHQSTTYSISNDQDYGENFEGITHPVVLLPRGAEVSSRLDFNFGAEIIYTIVVTTTDKAGNTSTNTFEIRMEGPWA